MRFLRQLLFADPRPPAPVLLRIAEPDGGPAPLVEVLATWFPSGRQAERAHLTAAGLCVIPWLGDEERVRLAVRTSAGASELDVSRDRSDEGRVCDVRLST